MTLKVVGVYSKINSEPLDEQLAKVTANRNATKEIFRGRESKVKLSLRIIGQPRIEKLTELTKQLLDVPIAKLSLNWIAVSPGGVLDDRHYYPPENIKRNSVEYIRRRVNEVNIFSKEELDQLNEKLGTNTPGGGVGENILVSGHDINNLSLNALLKIGDEVVLRVSGRRSFCPKFIGAFYSKDYFTKNDYDKFDLTKTGLATQVIQSGIIKVGDSIEIIEPEQHTMLSLRTGKIKFELYDPVDPTRPPIPDVPDVEESN
jgi:hypothetical protein